MQVGSLDGSIPAPFFASVPAPSRRAPEAAPAPEDEPPLPASDPLQNLIDLATDITAGNPFPGTDAADLPPADPVEFLVWLITRAIEQRKALNATLFYASVNVGQTSTEQETAKPFSVADLIKPIDPSDGTFGGLLGPANGPSGPASAASILQIYAAGRQQTVGRFVNTVG